MRQYTLGLALNYCIDWTLADAVREIFQNAIDSNTLGYEMFYEYDKDTQVLRIGNKGGSLSKDTLLLGNSSKVDNADMIGRHGEGYKVATVVLMRLGKGITIYNKKECWTAKVVKSRRYETSVVAFNVDKLKANNSDLVFEISGISNEEFEQITERILYLQDTSGVTQVKCGNSTIFTGVEYAGMVFVGGLFVMRSKHLTFGYDIEPRLISLDRDRRLSDSLDLQFLCSRLLASSNNISLIKRAKNTWDGHYLNIYLGSSRFSDGEDLQVLYDNEYAEFKSKYGDDATPVTSNEEFNRLSRNGYNPVLVTGVDYHFLSSATSFSSAPTKADTDKILRDNLMLWFGLFIEEDSSAYKDGKPIIDKVYRRLGGDLNE